LHTRASLRAARCIKIYGALRIGAALLLASFAAACSSSGPKSAASIPAAMRTTEPVASDANVERALVTACYGCHSQVGQAPWYGKLAPSYWFAGSAREKLDFSSWAVYDDQRRTQEREAIARTVAAGEMPPRDYTLLDSSAKLSADGKEQVVHWASEKPAPH